MKLTYRPEIDGLRAVAVICVILYHSKHSFFGKDWFSGGFVGVDVFFVISGYLISSLIFKELFKTGTFSFSNFYKRRIRRIIPALSFVMLLSIPFAWSYILPSSLIDFAKSIISSIFFGSNFYFHFSGLEYGSKDSLLKPFLHTWSLSVEEQFYILFPILLIFIFRYFKNSLSFIIFVGIILSFIFAEYNSRHNVSENFYFIYSRMWELLIGSILAFYEVKNNGRSKNRYLNLFLPSIGFILIIVSIINLDDNMRHPGLITLLPVIGTSMIIWHSNKSEFVCKILSSKIFVGTGLISYSLYLWHYPIFAISRITDYSQGNIIKKIALVVLILALSIFTYFIIEKPARNKNLKFIKLAKILFVSLGLSLIFSVIVLQNNGIIKNHPKIITETYKKLDYRGISQNKEFCHGRLGDAGFCKFNEKENNTGDIILLGDSIADALLSNFIEKVSKTNFRLINMSYSGNLYLPGYLAINNRNNNVDQNEKYHSYRKENIIKSNKNTYIIIVGNYSYYFDEKRIGIKNDQIYTYKTARRFVDKKNSNTQNEKRKELLKNHFKNTLKQLSKNYKVILLYPLPQPPKDVLRRVKNNYYKGFINSSKKNMYYLKDKFNYTEDFFLKFNKETFDLFDGISGKNIFKIYPHKIFCDNNCYFYNDDKIFFFDKVHPSYYGSSLINSIILEKILEIDKIN